MARMFRDSRVLTIGGGSSEIMREILAKMIIDDKQYKNAGLSIHYSQNQGSQESQNGIHNQNNTEHTMAFDTILSAIQERAAQRPALGNSLKFDLGDKQIFINGKGAANEVSTENAAADCTIRISEENFSALINGDLNPMGAFMSGKIKVDGDMSVALKLQSLLS